MTPLRVEQGESIQVRIVPQGGARAVEVAGIVWNDNPAPRVRGSVGLRLLGCLVSDPPPAFLDLLDELEKRSERSKSRGSALRSGLHPGAAASLSQNEADLPRSRVPLPPPKPEPEESLPCFQVRLKRVGAPRTRIVVVRARSVAQAEERARSEFAGPDGSGAWAVLEVAPCGSESRSP
jgi:hypothetical protein